VVEAVLPVDEVVVAAAVAAEAVVKGSETETEAGAYVRTVVNQMHAVIGLNHDLDKAGAEVCRPGEASWYYLPLCPPLPPPPPLLHLIEVAIA